MNGLKSTVHNIIITRLHLITFIFLRINLNIAFQTKGSVIPVSSPDSLKFVRITD